MKKPILVYLSVLLTYLLLDFLWLGLISQQSYQDAIGGMMRESFPKWPWITFYLIYSAAVTKLVVLQSDITEGFTHVGINGALFGAAAYGAYNLTNYAILDGWPLGIALKDWFWGISVTTAIALAGFAAKCKFK